LTIGDALDKIYLIKVHGNGGQGYLNFPKSMIGKRVKIRLCPDDETRRDVPLWAQMEEKMRETHCCLCKKEVTIIGKEDKNMLCHDCREVLEGES
jgi:hypothetical protein